MNINFAQDGVCSFSCRQRRRVEIIRCMCSQQEREKGMFYHKLHVSTNITVTFM